MVLYFIDGYIQVFICSPYWILLFSFVFQLMIGCICEQRLSSHCREIISFNNEMTTPERVRDSFYFTHETITIGDIMCLGPVIKRAKWYRYIEHRISNIIRAHNRSSDLKWSFDNTEFSVTILRDELPVHQLSWNSPVFILLVCQKINEDDMV